MYKYSKFGSREVINKAFRMIGQIVGDDKIAKQNDIKELEIANPATAGSHAVEFFNFYGPDIKEFIRVSFPGSLEKTFSVLLADSPAYGFEHVLGALGFAFNRCDKWEENKQTQQFTRKLFYTEKMRENVFLNKELIEQLQTYSIKKYNKLN